MATKGVLGSVGQGPGQGEVRAPSQVDSMSAGQGGGQAPSWADFVGNAHALLYRASEVLTQRARPSSSVASALRSLQRSFAAVYDALDARAAPAQALRVALTHVAAATGELSAAAPADSIVGVALEALGEASLLLGEAEVRVPPHVASPTAALDLRASLEVPSLHLLDRPSLEPAFRALEPPPPELTPTPEEPAPRPTTFEGLGQASEQRKERAKAALQAARGRQGQASPPAQAEPARGVEVPPGFAPDLEPALSEVAFVRRQVRELFEEIVMGGLQRVPLPGDDWRSSLVLERRMLAAIDAVAALGPLAIAELEPLVLDSPVKDPSRVFAITMTLGCMAGRDALAGAERIFLTWERAAPAHARAFADALKLVPHPSVRPLLQRYLGDAEATHRALAIEVLIARGTATLAELTRAANDVPDVAALALPAYALTLHPGAADVTRVALGSEHAALREAAWLAMAYRGAPATVTLLRGGLAGPTLERAALLLALVGGLRDAQALAECVAHAPSPGLVRTLGWSGNLGAMNLLIDLLEHENEDLHLAAAEALERLTGAGLLDEVPVEPEDIAVPDVPDPPTGDEPGRPSLAYEVSDPRDRPEEGSPETLTRPSTDPARWRAFWQANARSFDPTKRLRRGQPYTPRLSLAELEGGHASPGERRLLQRELVIRTGAFVRFDPHDFVASQVAALEQWRPLAQRAAGAPGSWQLPLRS
ncbi:MAG: hypothetical protein MUF34_27390 [Polyangiaceae bacterium]|nr:hypothetical protein [Polyangiaceae bacterium]